MGAASASQAVTSLNEATIELLTAAQSSQSGSGGGTGQQMSALQQMLQQQQQILQESQALLQLRAAQEKMLQERQAGIKRLAGQQRSLREMAEKMEKDLKENKRILGRMEKMVEEMDEVIRDLDSGVLDEQTVRNEERILSRLLDANRSVHSRDYERKRLSETAEDVFSDAEGTELPLAPSQLLREEIRRAMSLKAPGEFEDLIRLYFRALAEEAPVAVDGE
jgi:myosin heavy subunit